MSAQFESFIDPFVIMFSVPFAFISVVWVFIITGTTLSIVTFIGLIMLTGIVVNDAIVLVDFTNMLRTRGLSLFEAIKKAGKRRLRPILMTTLTTVFGLIPMAASRGEGAEAWVPLGITVITGLTVSTLVTLVMVPLIYSIFSQYLKAKRK